LIAGIRVTVFDEAAQELHGTAALDPRRLTRTCANLETAAIRPRAHPLVEQTRAE
jgi:hypothetical protein